MSMQAPEVSKYPICHFIYTNIQSFGVSASTHCAKLINFTKNAISLERHPDIKANYELGIVRPYLLLANSPNNIIQVDTKVISKDGVVPADVGTVPFSMMIVDTIELPKFIDGIIKDLTHAAQQLHTTNPNAKFILVGIYHDKYKAHKASGSLEKYPHRNISEQRLKQLAQQFSQYGCLGAMEINMNGKLHHEAAPETSMHRFYRTICELVPKYYQQKQQSQAAITHLAQHGLGGGVLQACGLQNGGAGGHYDHVSTVLGNQYDQVSAPVAGAKSQYSSAANNCRVDAHNQHVPADYDSTTAVLKQ